MERERWLELYSLVQGLGRFYQQGVRYSAATIVGVYLWAVVHDRPVSWACRRENWDAGLWPGRLPSQSSMSRRLRSDAVQELLATAEETLRQRSLPSPAQSPEATAVRSIDSKPLPVGCGSKDRAARRGRSGHGLFARGYRLHMIYDGRAVPAAWCLLSMNAHDTTAAAELIPRLREPGFLVGDGQYDSNRIYDLAGGHGQQLVAPKRKGRGLGHHYQSPWRLRCQRLLAQPLGRELLAARSAIERAFSGLTSFGGGLGHLPAWVRTPKRVWLWVQAKLLINAVRILQRQHAMLSVA